MSTLLMLIPALLRVIAADAAANGFLAPFMNEILTLAAHLIDQGEASSAALQSLTRDIQAMIAADRDPTLAEWNSLKARSDAAHAALVAAATPTTA